MPTLKQIYFDWPFQIKTQVRCMAALVLLLSSLGGPVALAQGSADLALTKRADRQLVRVGQNVVYVITLTNSGPEAATDVHFGDSLPDQLNLVAFRCQGGSPSGGTFCLVNRLEPGETALAVVVATPIANIAWSERRVSNTAFIQSASSFDPNEGNNTASTIVIAIR
jgi:uncharacterized repeat protein (TIGR01451 family)